jgi:para-aminobenzoate synthetase component 1
MNEIRQHTIDLMNKLGSEGKPFVFLIDFDFEKPLIFEWDDSSKIRWKTPSFSNSAPNNIQKDKIEWDLDPIKYSAYCDAFENVQKHIHLGDTYLLNLTMPTPVKTNLSPEIFVRINDGIISSFPMKGTIDANIENAEELLLNDEKEVAEHNTIVDLIRNDLSIIASDVKVDRFMYAEKITTNLGDILQMSSQITAKLPDNYPGSIGTILSEMLPAGSICGAPKAKTVEIIKKVEPHERGYYTGIFGIFDGRDLDSCVLIRFIEQNSEEMIFKSGGGITFLSNCRSEYNEMIQKVYVPIG